MPVTGSFLIDLAVSFGGAAILVGISVLLGAWRLPALTAEIAKDCLRFDEPDFAATNWLVDSRNGAALCYSQNGDLALVFRMGDNFATRRGPLNKFNLARQGVRMVVRGPGLIRGVKIYAETDEDAAYWAGVLSREV